MPKPVCVRCQRFYRMAKSGVRIVEGTQTEQGALPGTQEPDKWRPYKLWTADYWQCAGCGHQLVTGFGLKPMSEQHHETFRDDLKFANMPQINDC